MNRKERALEYVDEGYDIAVTGRHVQVTEAMKAYAIEKVSKIERFTNRITDVSVIMDIQRIDHRVEIIMKTGHLKIKSSAASTDMYASIDKAVARLERQISRYKSKLQDHHAKSLVSVDMNVNVIKRPYAEEDDFDEYEPEAEESRFKQHQIVTSESKPLKTLTNEEAIMKMDLSKDSFLIFLSEEDRQLKVIYRRKDNNYGIIEPKL